MNHELDNRLHVVSTQSIIDEIARLTTLSRKIANDTRDINRTMYDSMRIESIQFNHNHEHDDFDDCDVCVTNEMIFEHSMYANQYAIRRIARDIRTLRRELNNRK